MDSAILTTLIPTGGAVTVGCFGLWAHANQTGKRIEDLADRISEMRQDLNKLREQFFEFKEVVNGRFTALDLEIARLLDKKP